MAQKTTRESPWAVRSPICVFLLLTFTVLQFARNAGGQDQYRTLYAFRGDSAGDRLGEAVSGAGDVNRDGYADLIAGAPYDDNNGEDSGSARVFSGKDGIVLYTFNGDSAGDLFGLPVSGAGDVNGDGYADVVVGSSGDDNNGQDSGSVRVFSGIDGAVLYSLNGDSAGDNFGWSVSGAGDVNGDGYAEVVVGSSGDDNNGQDSGSVRVFSGKDGTVLYTFNGDSAGDLFGSSVSAAGDVNRDGYPDIIVGAPYDDDNGESSGSTRVFSGKDGAVLYTAYGDRMGDSFGISVSGAGDVNRDGYADLIVGAHRADIEADDSGSARVLSGADGAILYSFSGKSARIRFGSSVSDAGDVNGDGYADVLAGAPMDSGNGYKSGSVTAFSGKDGTVLYSLNGAYTYAYFGNSVAGAGDVNGDGYPDIIVGALSDDSNVLWFGSARVYVDECPNDAGKTSPGQCGCGIADTDTDEDGTADCKDSCSSDASKTAPGQCGCGVVDTDTDKDGTADCNDECPADPNKTDPGQCGCGISNADQNGNGQADCFDPTGATVPTAPATVLKKTQARVAFQSVPGATYKVVLTLKGGKPKKVTTKSNPYVVKLKKGTWTVTYQIALGGITTKSSGKKVFKVK